MIIPDILDILICLLSVTRKSQWIFLSLCNFSNKNHRLREVTRFFKVASMARICAILLSVCTEELTEYEYECESDSDIVEEYLPFLIIIIIIFNISKAQINM